MMDAEGNSVAVLEYQVGLLRERNRVLTLENQELIAKIQQAAHRQSETQSKLKQLQSQSHYFSQLYQKQSHNLLNLTKSLQKHLPQSNLNSIQQLLQQSPPSTPTPIHTILECLTTAIQSFPQNKQNKQNFNRLQKLVNRRKEKIMESMGRSRDIVHVVKVREMGRGDGVVQGDLGYVVGLAERIVRRVKRSQVTWDSVASVLGRVTDLVYLRKSIRQEQKSMANVQRQLELGVGCRMIFEQISTRLIQMRKEQLEQKHKIQKLILEL